MGRPPRRSRLAVRPRVIVLAAVILGASALLPPHPFPSADAVAGSSPQFTLYAGPPWTESSGEPSLGVDWSSGRAMMTTGGHPPLNVPPSQHVTRIAFDETVAPAAATWTDVTPAFMTGNVDPVLNVDPTSGRTFAGGDDGACTILARTDDDGDTWLPVGNSCPGLVDHPTVGQGPPSAAATIRPNAALYPAARVVYVCQQEMVDACAVS